VAWLRGPAAAGIAAAVLLGGANPVFAATVASDGLPTLFVSACLDGSAKLAPGEAAASSLGALPRGVRQRLGKPVSAQVWKLNTPDQSFLYLLQYADDPKVIPRVCGLASEEMNLRAAADAVELRVTGEVHRRSMDSIEWTDPQGGFTALATSAGKFKVIQINWLSDAQRAAAIKTYRKVTP